MLFKNIPLQQVGAFTCRVASGGVGGNIELHTGAPDGPMIGSFEIKPTGGWEAWVELKSQLLPSVTLPDRTDVFAVFSNPGKSGLMNMDWLQFDPPTSK